jgi:hypothetical protein
MRVEHSSSQCPIIYGAHGAVQYLASPYHIPSAIEVEFAARIARLGSCSFFSTSVIPQVIIGIKSIPVVSFGLRRLVNQLLNGFLCPLPDHLTAQIAAGETIYDR